jgi:hypothetical protein
MYMKVMLTSIIVLVQSVLFANEFESFEMAFQNFAKNKKYEHLLTPEFEKQINEKKSFIELKQNNVTVQFGKYTSAKGEDIYVFNYFADSSYNNPGIRLGCYKYKKGEWVEVTDEVLPIISYKDFYGNVTAPPKSYLRTVQYRFVLHKNLTMHIVIEPRIKKDDAKFDRIFDRRKYAAVKTRWNKSTGQFEIVKWLK